MVQADKKLADFVEHSDSMIHHEVTPRHCSRIGQLRRERDDRELPTGPANPFRERLP